MISLCWPANCGVAQQGVRPRNAMQGHKWPLRQVEQEGALPATPRSRLHGRQSCDSASAAAGSRTGAIRTKGAEVSISCGSSDGPSLTLHVAPVPTSDRRQYEDPKLRWFAIGHEYGSGDPSAGVWIFNHQDLVNRSTKTKPYRTIGAEVWRVAALIRWRPRRSRR
jgi:hypothetical protein